MGDGTLATESLLDFAKQGFDLWSEYLGSNIMERAANTTWKRMTNMEGGAGRVAEALTRILPEQIGDHQKLWNLLTLVWSHFDIAGFGVCPRCFKIYAGAGMGSTAAAVQE